jgi:hypothetical protein
MTIQHIDGMTPAQEGEAKQVLDLLDVAYPGHPWSVRVMPGCIFIRHLEFGASWGMNLRTREVDHDAAVLRRKVVYLAGEWLERAGLRRSRAEDGKGIDWVEGVPLKDQPPQSKPSIEEMTGQVVAIPGVERTTPLPQVEKAIQT